MSDKYATTWRQRRAPGRIVVSNRFRYFEPSLATDPTLIEDIVLESMPLQLEQPEGRRL